MHLDPVRRHPPRHRFAVMAGCLVLLALAIAPRAFAAVIGALFCIGAAIGFVAVRGAWRTLRRPLGSLSVGDALLGAAALRRWNRHHPRRPVYPPGHRDWAPDPGPNPAARPYR
jgi:membrane protein implicated in regulation of membrane protease activity